MVWWALALRVSGMGFYIAVCIVGSIALGIWLDSLLGTRVVFFLAFLSLGLVATFYGIYRMVAPLMGIDDESEEKNNGRVG